MAELEPGHPDELVKILRNWMREAESPIGDFPAGVEPIEWAIRQFINCWSRPLRSAIEDLERCLQAASDSCTAGDMPKVQMEIDNARQLIGEDLRDHLGLFSWNKTP